MCCSSLSFFLLFTGLFLWAIHSLRRILFFLYFWQIKEYRLDRFLEETKRRKKIIFSNVFFLALAVLLLWFIFFDNRPLSEILVFTLYLFFGLYSLLVFWKEKWSFPQFTKKMLVLFGFITVVQGILVLQFFNHFFLFILVLEILFPVFIFLCVKTIQIPVYFAKKRIIRKAKKMAGDLSELAVIGITGSYGKTFTKEVVYRLLAKRFKTLKTSKHINTEIGIAKTVLQKLKQEYKFFVCEIAAYRRSEVKAICDIVKPKIGILTGINQQHLALFGSQENIIKGKYELIESLPRDGLAVFNGDNKYCLELYKKTNKPKRIYSLQRDLDGLVPDVWAEGIKIEKDTSSFRIVCKDGETGDFRIKLLGRHNILNILGAVCAVKEFGISLQEIVETCAKLETELGGMVLRKGINGLNIIDSSYSSNPDGVISALDYLKIWKLSPPSPSSNSSPSQREGEDKEGGGREREEDVKLVIVMPCLIELGQASKEIHRMLGKKIAQVCDLAIITTKDRFKEIQEGARESVGEGLPTAVSAAPAEKVIFLENPKKIAKKIKDFCQASDAVLLEGRVPRGTIEQLNN